MSNENPYRILSLRSKLVGIIFVLVIMISVFICLLMGRLDILLVTFIFAVAALGPLAIGFTLIYYYSPNFGWGARLASLGVVGFTFFEISLLIMMMGSESMFVELPRKVLTAGGIGLAAIIVGLANLLIYKISERFR